MSRPEVMDQSRRRWWTAKETAEILSLSEKCIFDLCLRGVLPSVKIGGSRRIDGLKLNQDLERQAAQAGQGKGKRL